ncbi:DNA glycosylase [Neurospora tetraspora]|uniref:Adenine DNA glycosylase n=1 Tax=Neurospora tetraspora TaxID=94610 RepID=A0AAE0JF32_9PEZI|nr:DNA glycosylase [Neurospora tetraspora]
MVETRRRSARIADAKFDPLEYHTAPTNADSDPNPDSDSSALSDIDESEFDSDARPSKRRKTASGQASRAVRKTRSTTVKTVTTKTVTTRTKASATTTARTSTSITATLTTTTKAKPKSTAASIQALITQLFDGALPQKHELPCLPSNPHSLTYHNPLLFSSSTARTTRDALLTWFDSVSSDRQMPWRKPWIDTTSLLSSASACPQDLREAVAQRAYEVLLSETMLQQTRVSTVIPYYNKWLAALPTMQSLAAAQPEEVLSLWKGLGYYSRATRLHSLAQLVCPPCSQGGYDGLLPHTVAKLMQLPGVGRYTAGAVASIVYGRAEPMVDGNVIRVLARQLGIRGDVKSKKVLEVVWEAAKHLVEAAAWDGTDATDEERKGKEPQVSDRPGRWGQGLMELGATVCLPGPAKPKCGLCPIKETCRAYQEGVEIATQKGLLPGRKVTETKKGMGAGEMVDIEDSCTLCPPPEAEDLEKSAAEDKPDEKKGKKKGGVSAFFDKFKGPGTHRKKEVEDDSDSTGPSLAAMEVITSHCSKYPYTKPKTKKLREEECLVVSIRRQSDGCYLIHKRPAKGLLAGMWELPSHTLPADSTWNDEPSTKKMNKVRMVLKEVLKEMGVRQWRVRYWEKEDEELGTVPWTFSHFKLMMHVWAVDLVEGGDVGGERGGGDAKMKRWATVEEIEGENMGTGMKKCWELVKGSRDLAGGSG